MDEKLDLSRLTGRELDAYLYYLDEQMEKDKISVGEWKPERRRIIAEMELRFKALLGRSDATLFATDFTETTAHKVGLTLEQWSAELDRLRRLGPREG